MRRALVPFLALLALTAGCGGSEEEDYRKEVDSIESKAAALNRNVLAAARQAPGQSDKQVEKRFGQLAQTAGETQQDLDELDPPEDAKDEQDALVEALGNTQDALNGIERAANRSDRRGARDSALALNTALGQLRTSRQALTQAAED